MKQTDKMKPANKSQTKSLPDAIASPKATSKGPRTEPARDHIRTNTGLTPAELDVDHLRVEQSLRASELRYRRLFETAQEGILILDAKTGAITDVNPYLIEMLGYSRKEFIQKKLWQVGAFKDIEASKDAFEILQKNEYIRYENLPLKAKDGRLIQVEFVSNVYLVGDERVMQCNIRDVTERKRIIVALQENERKYLNLVNQSPDGVFVIELPGNILTVNKAMCDELGFSEEEFLSMTIWDIVPEQHLDQYRKSLTRILGGESLEEEADYVVRGKDGKTHYVEVLSAPRYSSKDTIIGFQGIARDITARKRAREELRYHQDLLREMGRAAKIGGWEFDPATGKGTWTEEVARIHDLDPDDETSVELGSSFYQGESRSMIENAIKEAVELGKSYDLELELITARGVHKWVQTIGHPTVENGKVVNVRGSFQDVTERKRAEENLVVANKELVFQNEEKERRAAELVVANKELLFQNEEKDKRAAELCENKALLASVLDSSLSGIMAFNSIRDAEGAIVDFEWQAVNAAAERMVSRSQTEIVGKRLLEEMPGNRAEGLFDLYVQVVETGIPLSHEHYYEHEQVKTWFHTVAVKRLDGFVVTFSDITARKQAEEHIEIQLQHLAALRAIDIAISASMDLQLTLDILLQQVKTQLNVDATCVLLFNPHSQTLEYAAGRGFHTRSAQTAHIRLGEEFAGRAALERRIVQADDPAQIQKSTHLAALWAGEGFATYAGVPLIAKGEVKGVLEVYHRSPFHPVPEWISFLETLAGQAAIAVDSAQLFENLQHSNADLSLAYDATIEGWSRALDLRDKETEGHTKRVTEITMRLAKAMGIGDAELVHIRRGTLLHDIGKMGVPDGILLKPGPLTGEEWVIMRKHPQLAYDMLSPISYLRPALDIPYCHHEKWDGTGYPRGLKGEQIPLVARIFALVDVWDALRSDRPYRLAWPEDRVLEHIRSLAGTHFDPQVVKVCLESGLLGTQAPE